DRAQRIHQLASLLRMLPLPNYTLLRALISHLVRVVQNAGKTRMTVRNMGIVFSPTLGIPAGVVTLMMAEFAIVFDWSGIEGTARPPP
ncbi:RhoGAP-domain-containing protein, partial [Caulochytrium protostelioides]